VSNIKDSIVLNDRMITENELESMRKEEVAIYFKVMSRNFLGGTANNQENLSQDNLDTRMGYPLRLFRGF
jgi:hypothetical protein